MKSKQQVELDHFENDPFTEKNKDSKEFLEKYGFPKAELKGKDMRHLANNKSSVR
ncbi:MAG: hypothetical protein ACOVMQ_01505 [Cyclobacteriaceae bacterium]|jgi:hypothetical protein